MRKWINKLNIKIGTGKLIAFVAICLVAVLLVGVSIAWFSSQVNLTGSEFSTGTLEFMAYGYNAEGTLVSNIYPEGKASNNDAFANAPLFSDKDMKAGSVSTVYLAIENTGSLDLKYRLNFSVSEYLNSKNDLEFLGGYWYSLLDITSDVTGDIVSYAAANKAVPCNAENCSENAHTCTEKGHSENLTVLSQQISSGIISANSAVKHYYRLDYGVRSGATTVEYSGRKFSVSANVFSSQVGTIDDEEGFGVIRQVSTAKELDKAIENALPGDTILLMNNITYNGDLIINKCINFEAGGKTLIVNGNMIYDFVSTFPLKINLQGKGTIKVLSSAAVGGNFTISAPQSQVELIGGNTAGDLFVGNAFTVNATNATGSGGCIFSDIVVLDGEGKNAKAVQVRSNTRVTVSTGVTLERIEAAIQSTNIEIQNAGQINTILLSSMFQTAQVDAPQIYIHNYNRIFNIILPTWSVPFKEVDGNCTGNTRIVVSAGGVIDTLTGSDYFSKNDIEDEGADLYVEQIESGSNTALRVYYRNLPEQTNTTLQKLLEYYFSQNGITSYSDALKQIEKLEIVCRGDKVITATDFTYIKTYMSNIAALDMSQAALANNTLPTSALAGVSSLNSLLLPRSVTLIDTYALQNTSIKSLSIPATVTQIKKNSLEGITFVYMQSYEPCSFETTGHSKVYFFVPESSLSTYKSKSPWSGASLKPRIYPMAQLTDDGVTHVKKLSDGTYEIVHSLSDLANIKVGENVTIDGINLTISSVGESAYRHLKHAFTLSFSSSVTSISTEAFYTSGVNGIIDFGNVKNVGNSAFKQCNGIISILDGNVIETVGDSAFSNCQSLYKVVLPKVKTVGANAFSVAQALVTITFGENIEYIGANQFISDEQLREITIKNPVADSLTIDDSSFFTNLESEVLEILRIYVPAGSYGDYFTKFTNAYPKYVYTLCEDGELYGTNNVDVYNGSSLIGTVDIGQFRINDLGNGTVSISSCNVFAKDVKDSDFWTSFNPIPETVNGKNVVRLGPSSYRSVTFSVMTASVDNTWGNNNAYIPDTLKEIAGYAFYKSDISITSLNSVEVVGDYAFEGALKMYYVDAPSLLTIGDRAFDNCSELRQFRADKLTSVGSYSFYNCKKLIRLYVESLPNGKSNWLTNDKSLTELWIAVNASSAPTTGLPYYGTYPDAVILTCVDGASTDYKQYAASKVFSANISPYVVKDDNGNTLCVLENMADYLVVEDTTDNVENTVTIINHFQRQTANGTVHIPGTLTAVKNGVSVSVEVRSLGNASFAGVDFGNNSVSFASTIKRIGTQAFIMCSSLTGVVNLNSVEELGDYAFSQSAITNVVAPNLMIANESAFEACKMLKTVSMPELTTTGKNVFEDCTLLESVYFEKIKTFGSGTFTNDKNLKSITINRVLLNSSEIPKITTAYSSSTYSFDFYVPSQSVALYKAATTYKDFDIYALDTVMSTTDGNYSLIEKGDGWELISFTPLTSVTTLIVPQTYNGNDIIYIRPGAFSLCSAITSITLPASYCHYQYGAFSGMNELQSVLVASGSGYYKSVDGVLFTANGDELVYYPVRKTLTSYTVPAGTKVIQSYAFEGVTALQSVTISADVSVIGYKAFEGCGIKTFTFLGTSPAYLVDTDVFNTNIDGFAIYVPAGSSSDYKVASGFIKYKDDIFES